MSDKLRGYLSDEDETVAEEIRDHMEFQDGEYYAPIVPPSYKQASMKLANKIIAYRPRPRIHISHLPPSTISLFDTRRKDWLKYWRERDEVVKQIVLNLHDIAIYSAPGTKYPRILFFRDDFNVDYLLNDPTRLNDMDFEYQVSSTDKRIPHALSWFIYEKGLSEEAMNAIYQYPLF